MARLAVVLALLAALACGAARSEPPDPPVAVLRSPATLEAQGWRGEWEFGGAAESLRRLGLPFRVLTPAELEGGAWKGRLLVLPDVRLMAAATGEAVERHVAAGGKILATYQTSYRDEANRPLQPPGFRLTKLFGADFHRWAGSSPQGVRLAPGPDLGGGEVDLGKPEAMLVRLRPGATALASWTGPDPTPAVVEGPGGVYAGASLFAPENSDSPEVLRLLGRILERLLPGWKAPGRLPAVARVAPRPPFLPVPPGGPEVAVGLAPFEGEAVVAAPGGVTWEAGRAPEVRVRRIETVGKPPALALYDGKGRLLLRSGGPLRLGGSPFLQLVRLNPNGTYRWSAFRGDLLLTPAPGRVAVVSLAPLEAYLAGVVPNEMPPWFPPQALRAMAVVARTFTRAHLGRHREQGHDLCATVHCQVFEGLASEHPATAEAVAATAGQALEFQGQPADTTYHAVCGGEGEAPEAIWPEAAAKAYLPGGPDLVEGPGPPDLSREEDLRAFLDRPPQAFCSTAGRFRWEESWSLEDLQKRYEESLPRMLGAEYRPLGRLQEVAVVERTAHGRVAVFEIRGDRGRATVRGDAVRWLTSGGRIGAGGLQSALFYVDPSPGRVRFRGGGWGHGVGLCQEGAAGRARAGADYRAILEHYYPGTVLQVPPDPPGELQGR